MTDTVPLLSPQVVAVDDGVSTGPVEAPTVTVAIEAHPDAVTVTLYVPDARPVAVESVDAPLLFHK